MPKFKKIKKTKISRLELKVEMINTICHLTYVNLDDWRWICCVLVVSITHRSTKTK